MAPTEPLLAVYASWQVAAPMCATKEEVLMMEPWPARRCGESTLGMVSQGSRHFRQVGMWHVE